MIKLPKGYIAVASPFIDAPKNVFTYKGVEYEVEEGVNSFPTLTEALPFAVDKPDQIIEGLDYESFDCPVILFSAGVHRIGRNGKTRVLIDREVVLLGQKAGVKPNLPMVDPRKPHPFNPERQIEAEESILKGGIDYGSISVVNPLIKYYIVDGFTCSDDLRFRDLRSGNLETDCEIVIKNTIHKSPNGTIMYFFDATPFGKPFERRVLIDNVRFEKDFFDLGYGGVAFILLCNKTVMNDVCIDGTSQIFGFTDAFKSWQTGNFRVKHSEIEMNNCYFGNFTGENGIATHVDDWGFTLSFNGCTLLNASRENESPLQLQLPNPDCYVNINGCHIIDTRENKSAMITYTGSKENISINDTVIEGFAKTFDEERNELGAAPDHIRNEKESWESGTQDSHTVVGTDAADFSALDAYYEGCRAYYGDQHAHSNCGGTSDGHTLMSDWVGKMDAVGLDFAIIVDHRQMRGFFLPEWSEERFVMGSEPGAELLDPQGKRCARTMFHYNMVVPHKYGLAMVLANFPEFNFKGDELTGTFGYPNFTKQRLYELNDYLRSIGGMLVHAHPRMLMGSDDPLDYYFGENSYIEVIVNAYDTHVSQKSYNTWSDILKMGKHLFASGGSDTHGAVTNCCPSTFYTTERHYTKFVERMYAGDYAVGGFGVKMFIDGNPMGSRISYKDGMKLTIRVGDVMPSTFKADTVYELQVITDEGVAYSSVFNGKEPQALSLEVKKRRYYYMIIKDLTHGGFRVCVSNPIWLDKDDEAAE